MSIKTIRSGPHDRLVTQVVLGHGDVTISQPVVGTVVFTDAAEPGLPAVTVTFATPDAAKAMAVTLARLADTMTQCKRQ